MTPEQPSNSADPAVSARQVIDEASVLGRNRCILLATLAQAGAVTATATYVGCGDSGGVEDVSVEMPPETSFDLISDEPQQAHVVSYRGWKMGSPSQEVNHEDEPSAVSTWTFDGRVL